MTLPETEVFSQVQPSIIATRGPEAWARRQVVKRRLALGGLCVLLAGAMIWGIGAGAVHIAPGEVAALLGQRVGLGEAAVSEPKPTILWSLRVPRVLLAVLVGSALGLGGAVVQSLFRNPLAEPSLIGISGGAAAAVVLFMVLGASLPWLAGLTEYLIPVAAFLGGMAAVIVVYRLATTNMHTHVSTLVLAGIMINALTGAIMSLMIFLADDAQLRSITFWAMGSLGGARWQTLALIAPCIVPGLVILPLMARTLNVMALGETEASHLGVRVQRMKTLMVLLVALGVGGAVAASGIIGFIGLIVPHLLRMAFGPDHQLLLPGSALLGASLLLAADVLARVLAAPMELPIGILTAMVGAPFFIWLLLRDRGRRSFT